MCHEMQEQSIYIYYKKARLIYQPIAVAGAVLKSKRHDHATQATWLAQGILKAYAITCLRRF